MAKERKKIIFNTFKDTIRWIKNLWYLQYSTTDHKNIKIRYEQKLVQYIDAQISASS